MTNLIVRSRKVARIVSLGDVQWLRALRQGVAAGVEHQRVLHTLGSVRMVLDVGANRGQFALVARHCFSDARIISFEPLPGASGKFKRVFSDDPKVKLQEAAIGPDVGEVTMHVSAADDSSSLLPITSLQDELFPGTAEVRAQQVRVAPLRDFLGPDEIAEPALLKIDVQGYELEVLRGCEDMLDRLAYVYAECSFMELYEGQASAHEIIEFLGKRQFLLRGVYNMTYDHGGQAVQGDFLFQRQSKTPLA